MLSLKQKEFWNNANARWNIKQGATRSGKTYLDYFMIPRRIRAARGEGLIVLLGNTLGTLRRNIWEPLYEMYGRQMVGNISNDNTVNLFGKRCYVLGADKVSQVSKLQGAGFEYCYGDEITTWNADVFQMLKSRLSCPHSVFDGTCNPDSPEHWFKKFLDEPGLDVYQQNYTIDDNPFLTAAFVENLKREYAGTVFYARFILGQWMRAEGLVYQSYNPNTDALDTVPEALKPGCMISCDYGTQNATVFLKWREGLSGTWYCTDEYYYSGRDTNRQKTDQQYLDALRSFVDEDRAGRVIIDPSAASFIALLRQFGYRVAPARNDVLNGIRFTAAALMDGRVKVLKCCRHTMQEFAAYSWDSRADEDRPIKENDHCMDAMRYFAYTQLRPGAQYNRSLSGGL